MLKSAIEGIGSIAGIEASVFLPDTVAETGADSCTSDLLLQRARNDVVAGTAARCAVDHVAVERDKICPKWTRGFTQWRTLAACARENA
ncbi:hypothetical protein [Caballeronia mineralivorans]|uniref:hypothetical protein n=1 Tax=Caballeronia mineralivorans TaxID=2010198 RepID=UPI0014289B20|nr:hypothetical protein [Caballeronia mineralivorans]